MTSNKLAIIIAFYLSKFDKEAISHLGYKTDSEAFEKIGNILGVKKNYIKFRRDEFDPIHPWRKGWQRKMDNRIISAIEALQDIDEPTLNEIVSGILTSNEYRNSEEVENITNLFRDEKGKRKKSGKFILRGPTGKKAEIIFQNHHKEFAMPFAGELIDTRDLGCGYDFEIHNSTKKYFVEVKGLSEISGGILFTNKEWSVAKVKREQYFLVIVRSVNSQPEINIIQNPAAKLTPKRSICTSIQINWGISDNELSKII